MSDRDSVEKHSEQTLITLEQLSQTLEVMTCVVDRLKQHLNRQMSLTAELFQDEENLRKAEAEERQKASKQLQQKSVVVEISQQEIEDGSDKKIVH